MSLYVIDDHPMVRQMIGMLLRRLRPVGLRRHATEQRLPELGAQLLGQQRDRGFRRHHQLRRGTAFARQAHQQVVDGFLRQVVVGTLLAGVDALGRRV